MTSLWKSAILRDPVSPVSELLMLTLCPGHSDFIIQATFSRKKSLSSVRSSSFFFFIAQAHVDMAYFTTHNNEPPINAESKKKNPARNMVMFFWTWCSKI